MATKTPIALSSFFVFNSVFGPREGEEEKKILYFYPPETDIDVKIKTVGLCEAITKFTETFTVKPTKAVHTQKTRQVFLEPEPGYWMVMTLSVPHSQKTKDGQLYVEYHGEDVQDSVSYAVLDHAYNMFKLFMGMFVPICEKSGVQGIIQRLDHFFSRYLLTLKVAQSDILDVFSGLHFLPLDKNTYLRIQCFINLLESSFPQVRYSAFLYNDQLVWSGLEQDDMRVMYRYLITSLFPSNMEQEFQGSQQGGATTNSAQTKHYGKFITGPPNVQDDSNLGKVPRVYVNTDTTYEECHLLVYKALSASICLLVDASFTLTGDYYRRLDNFLGPSLSSLASDIGDQYSKRPASSTGEIQFKYVYFNQMNLAQKTTVHADGRKSATVNVHPDVLRLLADLNNDLETTTAVEDGETIVKTVSDCWVVGKKSDQREFYVIINQKNANLIEINEEVKKLCATHFSNIFFLD